MSNVPINEMTPTLAISTASSSSIVVKPDCDRALAHIGVPQVDAVFELEVRVIAVGAVAALRHLDTDLDEGRVDQVRLVREDVARDAALDDDLPGLVERKLSADRGLPAQALALIRVGRMHGVAVVEDVLVVA